MCNQPATSRGIERDLLRFLKMYQVAVEGDSEGILPRDKRLQPLGIEYASEITGRAKGYMYNTISPHSEQHPPGLKEFYRLMRSGMDTMVIDELLRPLGMAAYKIPTDADVCEATLAAHVVKIAKEIGDVFAEIQKACLVDGELGTKVSPREAARIEREALETIPVLLGLVALVREGGNP